MSPVSLRIFDIAEGQDVQLLLSTSAGSIDRNENCSNQEETEEAGDDDDLEETNIEVGVQCLPVEKIRVLESGEVLDPSKLCVWVARRFLPVTMLAEG